MFYLFFYNSNAKLKFTVITCQFAYDKQIVHYFKKKKKKVPSRHKVPSIFVKQKKCIQHLGRTISKQYFTVQITWTDNAVLFITKLCLTTISL